MLKFLRNHSRLLRQRIERMPKLFRFLGANMLFGLAVGVALGSMIVLTNAGGLNDLISGDGHPYLTIFALLYLFALTFAAVAMAFAVMLLPLKTTAVSADDADKSAKEEPPLS